MLTAAFDGEDEAHLVGMLRSQGAVLVSMVAELAGVVVGHVVFTRAQIAWGDAEQAVAALGPMAVSPAYQRQGIGGQIINSGLAACRSRGETVIVVLGHERDAQVIVRFRGAGAETQGLPIVVNRLINSPL